jgi:hypothetical protein
MINYCCYSFTRSSFKLNVIIDIHITFNSYIFYALYIYMEQSIYRVQNDPWFWASTGDLGMYPS